jgi:hypothetical protein
MKTEKQRANMLNTLKCLQITTAKNNVAKFFQEMVRWEYAAKTHGWLHCVTCETVAHVRDAQAFDAGHFIGGRRASVIFHPMNCHVQCKRCNQFGHGRQNEYRDYMLATYGADDVAYLEELSRADHKFTHEQLLDLKLDFMARTKRAKMIIDSL